MLQFVGHYSCGLFLSSEFTETSTFWKLVLLRLQVREDIISYPFSQPVGV
jgi:hypothetical protein